ncbi:MAG: cysteine desulfurase [Anaerolineae bacterium]|jgi:cysteine desulfurase/selenocysteine lyase|nr:cysteine desulfurase [Anaerolineae bacterium]MBT3714890.1 cysteine desulfurase [Anaerolineae bacterium]MBT4310203.1 cysteine desulfurase [Anaerolineae bacterium]MBT4460176.1 cysteine desulfurase [Anaerolineae bacterium]MBT4843186.1 cysteine desulfurase [Anaerolineae bacterium]
MTKTPLDVNVLRADFPILERKIGAAKSLIYLDSTATSQKPTAVIDVMNDFYRRSNANIHRGVHTLAEESTEMYEKGREQVASLINAASTREVIFTRNTTESINLVAKTWGRENLVSGDVIILTEMEHHSNLVPWQMLAEEQDLVLEFVPVTDDFLFDMDAYRKLLALKPKLVAFTQMSNVLGTITPAKEIIALAHEAGALTLVDGAQSVPHLPVDVQDLDADFLVFSAHKMLGPSGIGALYGKMDLLNAMPPFMGGGDMIKTVHLRSFVTNQVPYKFEAGTPAIAEAVGFGAAAEYLQNLGMDAVEAHEHEIAEYVLERLAEIPTVTVFGPSAKDKGGVASFVMDGIHPHDIAQILDGEGIAVRAGHHCAQPLHEVCGVKATTRASFYIYNTKEEVDKLVEGIYIVKEIFG